ncbi:chromatin regulatory protein sir2, putative [Pediculus humanus corporis]|uniref:protein acetyllysine N-acetyltransferase n=1 Tax=Pediculus humanus subsp. corporis TaxID=121224 RepID=E0VRL7_PEDHC|nr:chromatin regulatory protein sir2, putative [Pediculus humanus corporis]EEB16023.1 chromatin regulatory protein sir2, putative [Pediculus humanus corporis]
MSCNYADGLSPYHDKGQLGLEEKFDIKSVVSAKVSLLAKWINEANHVVIHTGAGISTSAGIPDFRGPRGVWTLQAKGEKPDLSKDFNEAIPTVTHMAIMKLVEKQKVKYVVSQNIDGLHLRSNLRRKYLSELHGNMFTEQCNSCNRQFVRSSPVPTVGQKSINKNCPATKANGRPCRGRLHDTILDWEHNLPENDLGMADYHSCLADLSICLGTTMQIVPSGNLPLYTKRHGGKLVIVNLQPTKHDRKANLLIHAYVDEVMTMLMKHLNIKIPKYAVKNDPTRILPLSGKKFFEWTISDYDLKKMKKVYEEKCGTKEAKKRLEMISNDIPVGNSKNLKRKIKEDEDSDLEVLDVIVKPKKGRESSRRGSRKNSTPVYNTTITIKKVTAPPKKVKYDGEKITIKKNVTPTKTKYEIVTKPPKKVPKCEIVYCDDDEACNDDLDMICESDDDDEMTNKFTYNFKIYLQNDDVKKEETEVKTEVKSEDVITPEPMDVDKSIKNIDNDNDVIELDSDQNKNGKEICESSAATDISTDNLKIADNLEEEKNVEECPSSEGEMNSKKENNETFMESSKDVSTESMETTVIGDEKNSFELINSGQKTSNDDDVTLEKQDIVKDDLSGEKEQICLVENNNDKSSNETECNNQKSVIIMINDTNEDEPEDKIEFKKDNENEHSCPDREKESEEKSNPLNVDTTEDKTERKEEEFPPEPSNSTFDDESHQKENQSVIVVDISKGEESLNKSSAESTPKPETNVTERKSEQIVNLKERTEEVKISSSTLPDVVDSNVIENLATQQTNIVETPEKKETETLMAVIEDETNEKKLNRDSGEKSGNNLTEIESDLSNTNIDDNFFND